MGIEEVGAEGMSELEDGEERCEMRPSGHGLATALTSPLRIELSTPDQATRSGHIPSGNTN